MVVPTKEERQNNTLIYNNMQNFNKLISISVALLAAACTTDPAELAPVVPTAAPQIRISSSIDQQYISRVNDGGFCDGDQIGLYGVNYTNDNAVAGTLADSGNQVDNARYTYDEANNAWTTSSPVYYKDAVTHIDLYGYYPYGAPSLVGAYRFEVAKDQSGAGATDGYAQSDFLWGKAADIAPSENRVKLTFNHRLACANVILSEGEGFDDGEFDKLDKAVIVLNTTRNATIDLATGTAVAEGEPTAEGIVMRAAADGFRAIVVPQSVEAGAALFAITIDGITYRFKRDVATIYEQGKQSKFTITINRKLPSGDYEFVLTDCDIVDWVADLETHGGEARQYYVVEQSEPGTLGSLIRAAKKNPAKIKNLKVSGKIDARDFYFMRDSMTILQAINLKESKICGVSTEEVLKYSGGIWYGDYYGDDEIPNYAFCDKNDNALGLVHFVFPEKVTRICRHAFNSTLLSDALIIPNDVVEIDDYAFCGTNISSLSLPYGLKKIGDNAFAGCSSMTSELKLPETLEKIGDDCFENCSALTGHLTIPGKIKEIPIRCFSSCSNLTGLTLPEGIQRIGYQAFRYDSHMTGTLHLPAYLTSIGDAAFYCCSFQGELVIPNGIKKIETGIFEQNNFSSVVFPNGLISIEENAFSSCRRITEPLVFPESLITIKAGAFGHCTTVPSIVLPKNVATIGSFAFSGCYGLSKITCEAEIPPAALSRAFDGVAKDNFTVEVPEQSVVRYQTATGWNDFRRIAAHHDFAISRPLLRTLNAAHKATYLLRAPAGEAWSIESKPDWVTVEPASGVGKTEVTVAVDAMAAAEAGTFEIEIRNGAQYISTETNKGRAGEVVFLLDNKDYRTSMKVEQYDYEYADGDVITNQSATEGGGVNVVFMGDCFDARDIARGSYKAGIDEAICYFFDIEPYKTYRNYFNIYTVVGMSPDSGMGTVNTVKEACFGSQYSLDGIAPDTKTTYEYACKTPTVDASLLGRTLVVMVENTQDYGGITYMWGDGSAIAVCPMSRDAYPYDYRGIVQHEAGGHGFGKLGDEYIYHNAFIQSCTCLDGCGHDDELRTNKSRGWFRNLSLDGNMHTVEWAHLIMHPKYSNIVDMYEGGYFHTRGVYRSEATSCMNNNIPYYSAISRQEIVERIMRYAGKDFSIDDFYAKDVRDASSNKSAKARLNVREDAVTLTGAGKQMPPKFMGEKLELR